MAEFLEVIKQKERMCKFYGSSCEECPLKKADCMLYMINHPEEAEKIVMNWAKEHLVMTNTDKFKEVFGFIPNDGVCPQYCPDDIEICGECKYFNFWHQEYEVPTK